MKKVFSVEEIKEIEASEFRKRGKDSFSLMVDAGINCAKKIIELLKESPKQIFQVVAGPGKNAGDGFIIANYLHKKNRKVEVFCLQKKT